MQQRANVEPVSGEATVTIERLAHQGDGVAMVGGRAIHVPLSVPGDRLRIAYGGARGHVIERLADGADRAVPPCPYFGSCGGCKLQHLTPEAYRHFKFETLRETLAQRGIREPPLDPLTVVPAATRRRATFAFRIQDHKAELGFFRAATRAVLAIERCLLLAPALEAAIGPMRAGLARYLAEGTTGRLHITVCDNGLDADLSVSPQMHPERIWALAEFARDCDLARLTLDTQPLVMKRKPLLSIDGIAISPPPLAFLQPSYAGEDMLLRWVKEGVGPARRVVDLFAGLGTFALPLARRAQVFALDSDSALLAALSGAAKETQGLKPVEIENRDLLRNPLPPSALAKCDAAVFDPPRAGAKAQTQALAQARVARIVAVSCNAATFARDAALLTQAGYRLEWIRPLDQFLWSAHIELVALFTRETSS